MVIVYMKAMARNMTRANSENDIRQREGKHGTTMAMATTVAMPMSN